MPVTCFRSSIICQTLPARFKIAKTPKQKCYFQYFNESPYCIQGFGFLKKGKLESDSYCRAFFSVRQRTVKLNVVTSLLRLNVRQFQTSMNYDTRRPISIINNKSKCSRPCVDRCQSKVSRIKNNVTFTHSVQMVSSDACCCCCCCCRKRRTVRWRR